ncbi:RNA polymerase sigma factor [Acidicapsa ligni]|uniref:RNA polymerase sigma factor n=1 Tax=Acidicapsa ligni TaxID=542300 RepID=UPI0021E0F32A|nr:RNA polymerase sigma factor [Acidicapsa ligni]
MGSRQTLKIEKVADHEGIFLDHYARLLDRALRLTRGSKHEAEDLVQDLYVRFVFSPADVDVTDSERLQGYLFRALQNLSNDRHRGRGRDPLSSLHTVDYDSMETALAAADRSRVLYIRSDLAGICEYACFRRKSSRAGSILILRFFLGYFPSEIAALLKTSPAAVHKLVESARLEAKAFLTRPGSLHLPGQDSVLKTPFAKLCLPDDPAALLARFHTSVFADKEGDCFNTDDLDLIYSEGSEQQLTTREVAHLVSCRSCLERANHLLQFPELSKRFPDDPNDRNNSSNPPSSRALGKRTVEKMRKKLQATREHRPKTLEISVDGYVLGAQRVTSALSRFQIVLEPSLRPQYISVLSEQGYSLLYLDLQVPESRWLSARRTEIELSDDRSLLLELSPLAGSSVIDLTYYDPSLEVDDHSWVLEEESLPILEAPSEEHPTPAPRPMQPRRLWQSFMAGLSGNRDHLPIGLGAAIGIAALIAVSLPWLAQRQKHSHGVPTATTLLAQAERSAQIAIPAGGATRQTFSLEVRTDSGKLIESATIQTLHGSSPERRASRLIGTNDKLLAGRWSDSAGRVTTYTPKGGMRRQDAGTSIQPTVDDVWSHVPEAADFDRLANKPENIRVQQDQQDYELVYSEPPNTTTTSLAYADLVLSGTDLHPTSETLRLKEGKVTREYRFRELTYNVLSADQVTESDFDPEPSLNGNRSSVDLRPAVPGSSAHLALEALQLLNNLGPDAERTVNLERHEDGTVELDGVFPTSAEKTSIVHVFRSLQSGALLQLNLHASEEAASSPPKGQPVQVESLPPIAVETAHIPFDAELRPILSEEGLAGTQLEERMRQISSSIVSRSAQLHRDGWGVSQIAAHDFTLAELQAMTPEDQMLWLTLLEKHIHSFDEQMTALRTTLTPLWHDKRARYPDHSQSLPSLHDAGELQEAAIILNHDSERLDRLLTAGFTLSPSSLPANYNFADIGQLMSDLDTEEKTLQGTIERLHTFGQAETRK